MMTYVIGAGHVTVKAGRKKFRKACRVVERLMDAHLVGVLVTMNQSGSVKRPVYTIEP